METDSEAVVWDASVGIDISEDSEDTGGLCIRATRVVVVDGKTSVISGVLEGSGERGVDEGKVGDKGGA